MSYKKKIAVLQSNYIPWKGYFDIIRSVDEFVIMDDVQYTRRDWRNRNIIKTKYGLKWLTIPVSTKGKYFQLIKDVEIVDRQWAQNHWNLISESYRTAPWFSKFGGFIHELYEEAGSLNYLSEINILMIKRINRVLGINTVISNSSDFKVSEDKNQRLIDICNQCGANGYLTGPLAKQYINQQLFFENNITISWIDYDGYKTYPQQHGNYCHNVSIIDLLLNTGDDALLYFKGV